MAVLIKKSPHKVYQSVGGIEVSDSEREQADRLDSFLENEIKALVQLLTNKKTMPDKKGKASLDAYWELGRCLRTVVESDCFVQKAELPLLWINAKSYIPEELIYKERGPYREHLWYCFRLASYPKELANKMNWGEWVTIFDSSGINQEPRFDKWFNGKLSKQKDKVEREEIRIFAPCVNAMLGNIDHLELTDNELYNCYEAAWHLTSMWAERTKTENSFKKNRKGLQASIIDQLGILDSIMDGTMSSYEYAIAILEN
jgi:hypothetical protein